VSVSEHSATVSSSVTGVLPPRSDVLSWGGVLRRVSRARFVGRGLAGGVVGLLVAFAGLVLFASSATAANPPHWESPPTVIVHSTRATIMAKVYVEELAVNWEAEYSTVSDEGPWIPVDKGERGSETEPSGRQPFFDFWLGEPWEKEGYVQLQHLQPDTQYYARFFAETAEGTAELKAPFKTLPVAKPEITKVGINEDGHTSFRGAVGVELTDSTAAFSATVEANGADTEYTFEYAESEGGPWVPFTSEAKGTVTASEEARSVEASLTGLKPETTYYVRITAKNEKGLTTQAKYFVDEGVESSSFMTGTAKPTACQPVAHNVKAESAHLVACVSPHGSQSLWRLESASAPSGPWTAVPGGEGTFSQAEAEATPYSASVDQSVGFGGLAPKTSYYVRTFTENEFGSSTGEPVSFETEGPPTALTLGIHALQGESVRLLGAVNPRSVPTSSEQMVTVAGATGGTFTLTFDGHTTVPIAYDASERTVESALRKLSGEPQVRVYGADGGPYTIFFEGGVSEGLIGGDGSGLTPSGSGSVGVVMAQQGGESYDVGYRFQYVSEESFIEHGWVGAQETQEENAGAGSTLQVKGSVLPVLRAGETYRYRLLVSSTVPGGSVVEGSEQSLGVPAVPSLVVGGCPNEVFRTGVATHLPDCRAYEQLTPVDKEGAQEPFHYRVEVGKGVFVGEDGEHAALEAPDVSYGFEAGSGQSPYFFAREAGKSWRMFPGAPQPETGIYTIAPQLFNADLTQLAGEVKYSPSQYGESPEVEYKLGPAGGPYKTIASVPRQDTESGEDGGWVASSADFSKLVLQTRDHVLLGEPTGTLSGPDLYEYTSAGGLVQLNVTSAGSTIGSCGAVVAKGDEEGAQRASGPHSLSADGSRVFFEAQPGKNCSEAHDLYMRVDARETVDIGPYVFVAANAEGTRLLLKNGTGELVGYNTEADAIEPQSAEEVASAQELTLLGIPVQTQPEGTNAFARPRDTYWQNGHVNINGEIVDGVSYYGPMGQVYRYDNVEHVVECVSCASPFDSEPKQASYLNGGQGLPYINGGLPVYKAVSANGDFAFFTTIAALVPQDVDGEIPNGGEWINIGGLASPSTDVYEWRKYGIDGCAQVQGCLSLLTDGRGGYLNLLLGTADEGRDVLIYTRSKLLPQDNDASGDIYDVRIDGGLPGPPPRPTECEGDTCSSPPSAPNDATPSSLTFSGVGNVLQAPVAKTPSKAKAKKKPKAKKKTKQKRKKGKKASRRQISGKAKAHGRQGR
jgi:hypothetical protein